MGCFTSHTRTAPKLANLKKPAAAMCDTLPQSISTPISNVSIYHLCAAEHSSHIGKAIVSLLAKYISIIFMLHFLKFKIKCKFLIETLVVRPLGGALRAVRHVYTHDHTLPHSQLHINVLTRAPAYMPSRAVGVS
jgi:hypothetical protein